MVWADFWQSLDENGRFEKRGCRKNKYGPAYDNCLCRSIGYGICAFRLCSTLCERYGSRRRNCRLLDLAWVYRHHNLEPDNMGEQTLEPLRFKQRLLFSSAFGKRRTTDCLEIVISPRILDLRKMGPEQRLHRENMQYPAEDVFWLQGSLLPQHP